MFSGKRRKMLRSKLAEVQDCTDKYKRIAEQQGNSFKEARKKCESIREQIKRKADEEVARVRDAEARLLKEVEQYETSVLNSEPDEGESVS